MTLKISRNCNSTCCRLCSAYDVIDRVIMLWHINDVTIVINCSVIFEVFRIASRRAAGVENRRLVGEFL